MCSNDRSDLGQILDPNLKIKKGHKLDSYLNELEVNDKWKDKEFLSLSEVKDLWKNIHGIESLREVDGAKRKKVYLHQLLGDADLILPKLEFPERNPELEKRVAHLRNVMAEKEYKKMTKNVNFSSHYKPEDSIGFQLRQMNSGLIGVVQLVVSLAAAFLFGFMGIEVFVGGEFDMSVKLLLGIMSALIVGAAELYFLAINLSRGDGEAPNEKIKRL